MMFEQVGGSFRDPAGCVLDDGNTILRTVTREKIDEFLALWTQGVYKRLTERGNFVGSEDVTNHYSDLVTGDVERVLRHERPEIYFIPVRVELQPAQGCSAPHT